MNFEQLNFTVFCVGGISEALKMSSGKFYHLLWDSGFVKEYIVHCLEVLHTFSKEYLVEDIVSYMKEKGVLQ